MVSPEPDGILSQPQAHILVRVGLKFDMQQAKVPSGSSTFQASSAWRGISGNSLESVS